MNNEKINSSKNFASSKKWSNSLYIFYKKLSESFHDLYKKWSDFFYFFYKKIIKKNSNIVQLILWYLLIILFGALLLSLSFTKKDGTESIGFLNVLFVSSSAFSDTGLTTFAIQDVYNIVGEIIIFILIMLGGIGWFTFKYFIITYIFFKTAKRKTETEAKRELGEHYNEETHGIIKTALFSMLIMILIFGIIFGIIFATTPAQNTYGLTSDLNGNWGRSFWAGFFHANSAINNAGFDIFVGSNSMSEFYNNYLIQILTMFLFIFGGVGFAVIYDMKKNLKNKSKGAGMKFSLFTKISVVTYFGVAFIGLFFVYFFELMYFAFDQSNSFLGSSLYGGWWAKTWGLTFNTFSTRNAGFSTININDLSTPTKLTNISMMFIGSGPGSTAGGIRTTATAILLVNFFSHFKSHDKKNVIFNRKISDKTIKLSKEILIVSLLIVLSTSLVIATSDVWVRNNGINYIDALYVTTSAFGTTGLSTRNIEHISIISKLLLIFVMIVGQIGISNLIKLQNRDSQKLKIKKLNSSIYLEENVNLG